MKPLPSQEILHSIFTYDRASGELRWKHRADARPQWNSRRAGTVAGGMHHSGSNWRIKVGLVGFGLLSAHRIIWKMEYGTEPSELDHRNGDPGDNRLSNLRVASRVDNMHNIGPLSNRRYGHMKGAHLHPASGLWRARIRARGRTHMLGYFKTEGEAHAAYAAAAQRLHGEFARLR